MPLNRSTGVAVLLAVFVGILAYKSGVASRFVGAADGSVTVGGR